MSTKPRTREHFPRMKVRGGRRRHGNRAPRDPMSAFAQVAAAFALLMEIAAATWNQWVQVGEALAAALTAGTHEDYALVSEERGGER